MEKIVERNMLYDFYGELLTPHQQEIYESIIFQDLSLSEDGRDTTASAGREFMIW